MTYFPPDIVPNVGEEKLREIYRDDAYEVIAFRRFLTVAGPFEKGETVVVAKHWYEYAMGDIDGREVLRIDDEINGTRSAS